MWYSVNMTCAVVWQEALDEKLAAIEQNKVNLIALVKQTSAKLKFTLNGSVARDLDYLLHVTWTTWAQHCSLHRNDCPVWTLPLMMLCVSFVHQRLTVRRSMYVSLVYLYFLVTHSCDVITTCCSAACCFPLYQLHDMQNLAAVYRHSAAAWQCLHH